MIRFGQISEQEFLTSYWQKKPVLIKQALPDFITPIMPDKLAGLSLEEEFESRLITGSIANQKWSLTNGPFLENTFANLPEQDWTLLVQGVDRYINEVHQLIKKFDFIPRWRFDDVMISYATLGGSVGPHMDYYDVFLLQGSGERRWHISTKHCELDNYLANTPLRIMSAFQPEQIFNVEPGDILYIPPKVAHHGISLDDNCTTLSFGYRAYSAKEMYEFINKPCPKEQANQYYQDPTWDNTNTPALISNSAIKQANKILNMSAHEFAKFVTKLDILDSQILQNFEFDIQTENFNINAHYELHPVCKVAYLLEHGLVKIFINAKMFDVKNYDTNILLQFCNTRRTQNTRLSKQLFKLNLLKENINYLHLSI